MIGLASYLSRAPHYFEPGPWTALNQHSPFARFIALGISAITAIGDTSHDSEEEKLAHHHLVYMGALMSCGGMVWGTIALYTGCLLQRAFP